MLRSSGAPIPVRFGTWYWGMGHTPGHAVKDRADVGPIEFLEECKALIPHRQHINYFSDFNCPLDGRPSAVHYTGWIGCRTANVPLSRDVATSARDVLAPTLDVLVADHAGKGTRFRSLDLTSTGDPKDSYSFRGAGSRNVDGTEVSHNPFGWELRVGFHPGAPVYVQPPPPPTSHVPERGASTCRPER